MVVKSKELMKEMEALKIHGYHESDSDSGKSEFDEEDLKFRPPPVVIQESKLIRIRVDDPSQSPAVSSSDCVNLNPISSHVQYSNNIRQSPTRVDGGPQLQGKMTNSSRNGMKNSHADVITVQPTISQQRSVNNRLLLNPQSGNTARKTTKEDDSCCYGILDFCTFCC